MAEPDNIFAMVEVEREEYRNFNPDIPMRPAAWYHLEHTEGHRAAVVRWWRQVAAEDILDGHRTLTEALRIAQRNWLVHVKAPSEGIHIG